MFFTILCVILGILFSFYLFLIWNFNYWKQRGVNGPKPLPFFGNFPGPFTKRNHIATDIQKIYESYKSTDNFIGVFNSRCPQLMIVNPEMVRRVLVTDFKHFHDNESSTFVDDKSDRILSNNPFILSGEKWKERRAEVTPGLTQNRIKTVFPVTNKVCKSMIAFIEKQNKMGDDIEVKNLALRYTCEVVTDCVLGLEANTFSEESSPIFDNTKKLFDQSIILIVYMTLAGLIPGLTKVKKLRFVPKPIESFFIGLMESALELRKSQHEEGVNENRVDFMNYMLHLQEKKNLSLPELTSHTMTFLLDGFDTTANVLAHCLLLLARHPEKQKKLRDEISEKLGKENNFDDIMDLEYLDACIHESLRIYPAASHGVKLCTEPIDFVNKDGRTLHISVGTRILLPTHAIMADEDNYTNADRFEPERFLDGGFKSCKDKGIFYGFSDGPRVCLGMRFALAQMKAALVEILRNFKLDVNPRTRRDNKLDPSYLLVRLDGEMLLKFEKIN